MGNYLRSNSDSFSFLTLLFSPDFFSVLLLQLVDVYGHDVYVFLFRSLISHLDLKNTKASQDQIRLQLLGQELAVVANRPNYVSVICQAFEGAPLTDDFCSNLAKLLKLNFAQHLTFGLALAQSIDAGVQQQGSVLHLLLYVLF